ncbi:MAG: succinate dehydrogenase cytochrome b subunit [Thermoguttaceae bacterium]|nr:succinate dehydrogenase cytochrome b subunit [Thermoguttaceae bacterium]
MGNFLCSSIGKKLIMSLTGFFLLIFLALHLCLNLAALISDSLYRQVCEFMDASPLVKAMVPVLALGFIVHILFSIWVEFENWTARPRGMKYAVPCKTKASWSGRNMFVLGIIVIVGILLHLVHFWAHMQLQGFLGNEGSDPYELVATLFKNPCWVVLYLIWFAAIYFHVSHGFWSAFQTIGLSNSLWIPRLQFLAKLYAAVVCLAFAAIPICFLLFK